MVRHASCSHAHVQCLNEYETIRKYQCEACGEVMMCQCDEELGREFLPHQLREGTRIETQERIPVSLGFVSRICRDCRGLPPEARPRAAIYGQASKIKRYYWRELWRREHEILREWAKAKGLVAPTAAGPEASAERSRAAAQALHEIKELHARSPTYVFQEESQSNVLARCEVHVEDVSALYRVSAADRKAQVQDGSEWISVEEYAERYYTKSGWSVLSLESSPFHVLFGVYMWLVIQDPDDTHVRIVGFGDRRDFDEKQPCRQIWTRLPDDFGTTGYGHRRADAIASHLSDIAEDRENLLWLFDYWTADSEGLRNYLWAHVAEDIQSARKVVEILPPSLIGKVLQYLADDYWGRYLGWPDLLVYRANEFFMTEVKSSKDKLSEDQKRWIIDNHEILHIPFRVLKVCKSGVVA